MINKLTAMSRNVLYALPILIAAAVIFLPVLNPGLIPVNAERCGEYCERNTDCGVITAQGKLINIPAQPVNTWTNIAFIIAGFFVFRKKKTVAGLWFAISCAVLGLGSGAFHAFMSNGGHFLDLLGMFLVFNFLAIYSMFVTHKQKNYLRAVLVSAAASLVLALFFVDLGSTLILGVAGLTLIVHLCLAAINKHLTWKAVGLTLLPFVIAFIFRQLDVAGIFCDPNALYQGHGVWHIFAAIGTYSVFRTLEDLRVTLLPLTEA